MQTQMSKELGTQYLKVCIFVFLKNVAQVKNKTWYGPTKPIFTSWIPTLGLQFIILKYGSYRQYLECFIGRGVRTNSDVKIRNSCLDKLVFDMDFEDK